MRRIARRAMILSPVSFGCIPSGVIPLVVASPGEKGACDCDGCSSLDCFKTFGEHCEAVTFVRLVSLLVRSGGKPEVGRFSVW